MEKKVDLGCGQKKPEGFYGVDIIETEACDQVVDLEEESWDLPSNHFTKVRAIDVIEHLENPVNFLEEIHRISELGAVVIIQAPHRSSQNWTDPTHKRLLGVDTIRHYFTEHGKFSYYSNASFEVEEVTLMFHKRKMAFPNYFMEKLVNGSRKWAKIWEETWLSRIAPAYNIRFILRVRK